VTLTLEFLDLAMNDVNPPRRWTQRKDSARAQRAEATRQALVTAARELFAERGYHDVGVRDVTALAGVTRGAVTHHFGDKQALFLAVFDAVERELISDGAARLAGASNLNAWARFRASLQHYLDAATRPDVQRITLVDGPAVLGWLRWRELEEAYSLGALTTALQSAMDQGLIQQRPVEPLAHLILGSVMEAALLVAHSDNPEHRRIEVGQALDDMLRGLE
jgi:AcrR family transcriptional regulator